MDSGILVGVHPEVYFSKAGVALLLDGVANEPTNVSNAIENIGRTHISPLNAQLHSLCERIPAA